MANAAGTQEIPDSTRNKFAWYAVDPSRISRLESAAFLHLPTVSRDSSASTLSLSGAPRFGDLMTELDGIRSAIRRLHGCDSSHSKTVHVRETFIQQTAWDGNVEVFDLIGHSRTDLCYAWVYHDADGKSHYTTVLRLPPIHTPLDAVRAALIAQIQNNNGKETPNRTP